MDPGYSWHSRCGRVCMCHRPLWQTAPAPRDRGALVTFLPHTSITRAEGKAGSITKCYTPSHCRWKRVLLSPGELQPQHPRSGSRLVQPALTGDRDQDSIPGKPQAALHIRYTKSRWTDTRVTITPPRKSQGRLLACPTSVLWGDPCRIQFWVSSTAPVCRAGSSGADVGSAV